MAATTPQAVYLKDYRPPAYRIPEVNLTFDLREDRTQVTSRLKVVRAPDTPAGTDLELDGDQLKLLSLRIDGATLSQDRWVRTDDKLQIKAPPAEFTLEIVTEIYPDQNKAFSGLYKTKKIFCTQMEAQGFRRVTYFLDRPDVLSKYTTTIQADHRQYPHLLSNGEKVKEVAVDSDRHEVTWKDPYPKPCYLFALVAGNLGMVRDTYRTSSDREVALEIYTDPGNEERCTHAMNCLVQSMRWDEKVYGLEYDLNVYMIVAVDDFNMGAMENKGLNIFNSKYVLADNDTATDNDFLGIQTVIGHEYFHNWSGNRVTCRDWFQLSLKEGFTVFRDQEFSADMNSRAVKRMEDVVTLRTRQFPEDASGMAHPVRPSSYVAIDNFYTRTVYDKGAEVIRMMNTLLGHDTFIRGAQKYFETQDGTAATIEDFVKAQELVSGKDLSQFKRWYDQAGTPVLSLREHYDETKQEYTLWIDQDSVNPVTNERNKPFHLPFKMGLLDQEGKDLPLNLKKGTFSSPGVLDVREEKNEFVFTNIKVKPVLSPLREFSAPVKLVYEPSERSLLLQMAHDSDAFNRYEAAQRLYQNFLLKATRDYQKVYSMKLDENVIAAMRTSLKNIDKEDRTFLSRLLLPPPPSYLMQFCEPVIPHAVEKAYLQFVTSVQEELKPDFLEALNKVSGPADVPSLENAGWRALKATLLYYLTWGDDDEQVDLIKRNYDTATNMTDQAGTLMLAAHKDDEISEKILHRFHEEWKADPLVMNKWFTAQALSRRPDCLAKVKELSKHPSFDRTNPNNLFALVYAFTAMNPFRFHDQMGKGYDFAAEMILDVDGRNPQVAARLATCFNDWTKWHSDLKRMAKMQIERIHRHENLSKNVFEIMDRALQMEN